MVSILLLLLLLLLLCLLLFVVDPSITSSATGIGEGIEGSLPIL